MNQWLVRTQDNWIKGPFPSEQIREMIQEGEITLQDEVCPANGYWISLHEADEIKSHLGIEVPIPLQNSDDPDEETTETEKLLSDAATEAANLNSSGDSSTTQVSLHHRGYSHLGADQGDLASQMDQTPSHSTRHSFSGRAASEDEGSNNEGEPFSLWQAFAWFLVCASTVLILAIIRLLRR